MCKEFDASYNCYWRYYQPSAPISFSLSPVYGEETLCALSTLIDTNIKYQSIKVSKYQNITINDEKVIRYRSTEFGTLRLLSQLASLETAAPYQQSKSQRLKSSFRRHYSAVVRHSREALQGSEPDCSHSTSLNSVMANDVKELHPLILQLANADQRESALLELSKKREAFPDLAPVLWHSFGTIAALLQEIISIYPMLSPPTLSPHASNRVCNALALLQCVASHPETKSKLMNGIISLNNFILEILR